MSEPSAAWVRSKVVPKRRLVLFFPQVVHMYVAGDLVHPGREPRPGLEGGTEFQHAEKHLLGEIFGHRAGTAQMAEEAEQPAVMTVKEAGEKLHLSPAHSAHQLVVGQFHRLGFSVHYGAGGRR